MVDSGLYWEIGEQSSNSGRICYIHLHANDFWEGINPSLLPAMDRLGFIALGGIHSTRRTTLHSKPPAMG